MSPSDMGAAAELMAATIRIGDVSTVIDIVDSHGGRTRIEVPAGAHTLTGEISGDPPSSMSLANAVGSASDDMEEALRQCPDLALVRQWSASGPIATTAAAIELGVCDPAAIDGLVLTKSQGEEIFRTIVTESRADRAHNPGLDHGQLDTIVGGLCVLVSAFRRLGISELTIVGS
jgi:exopolyphosphatase/pppGpp-phosphohydrolase